MLWKAWKVSNYLVTEYVMISDLRRDHKAYRQDSVVSDATEPALGDNCSQLLKCLN